MIKQRYTRGNAIVRREVLAMLGQNPGIAQPQVYHRYYSVFTFTNNKRLFFCCAVLLM